MLNTNQSKKRNSWKYYVVIPALAAFVLLFQIEVIAKEKPQNGKEISGDEQPVDIYKIKKTTTDADLKEMKEKLKSVHNIDFKASEIKRNSENLLTAIRIDVKSGNEESKSIQDAGNNTIKDFGIAVLTDENGKKVVGIMTGESKQKVGVSKGITKDSNKSANAKVTGKAEMIKNQNSDTQTNSNVKTTYSFTSTKTDTQTNTNINDVVTINNNNTVTKVTTDGGSTIAISNSAKTKTKTKLDDQLIVVDGQEMPSNFNAETINDKNIESISIFKGVEAVARYGDKGKHGVIEIETKK